MKIFITGIAGFIGSHLAERLIEQGHTVCGIDNFSSGKLSNVPKSANVFTCDCRNQSKLRYIISETKPEFIYHLAATVGVQRVLDDPKECIENNIDSTRNILALGIPGIFSSTSEVYGKNDKILCEESPLLYSSKPRWSYAASKLIDEYLVKATPNWKIVRFFNVVGPRQSLNYGAVLPAFVKKALNCETLIVYGSGKQVRTFLDVRDCAEIIDRLRDKDFDVLNVGGNTSISIKDLAYYVLKVKRDHYGDILLPDECRVQNIEYVSAYSEGFEECQYRVPNLLKLNTLLPVLPCTSLSKTILDLAESIKKGETDEQIRQHEPNVSGSETRIPRLTRAAIR